MRVPALESVASGLQKFLVKADGFATVHESFGMYGMIFGVAIAVSAAMPLRAIEQSNS